MYRPNEHGNEEPFAVGQVFILNGNPDHELEIVSRDSFHWYLKCLQCKEDDIKWSNVGNTILRATRIR